MVVIEQVCEWPRTRWARVKCGRLASHEAISPGGGWSRLVCAAHARRARAIGWHTFGRVGS